MSKPFWWADLKAALKVVREVLRKSPEARKVFFEDQYSVLIPVLREAGSDGSIIEFSARVLGVFEWPGGAKLGGSDGDNEWFPDPQKTTIVIQDAHGEPILIHPDQAVEIHKAIRDAFVQGKSTVAINGTEHPIDQGVIDQLDRIPLTEHPTPTPDDKKEKGPSKPRYWYVKSRGNIEDLAYVEKLAEGRGERVMEELGLLRQPMEHQKQSISWLQTGFLVGMRGMLLADDMGVGKTFQVIAFLRWLRIRLDRTRETGADPLFMVVAPKTLLGNWIEEVETNVGGEGLGRPARLYGSELRTFRKITKRRDIERRRSIATS